MRDRTVRFGGSDCTINFKSYNNDRVAIQLWNDEGPMGTATINIPECDLRVGEVIIKDYSENKGIMKALVGAGIVEDTGKRVRTGFVECPICQLLVLPIMKEDN